MWNLIAGVIVIVIILLAVIIGYFKAAHEYAKVTGKYNPRDFENFLSGRPSQYDRPDLNPDNRRRNVSSSDREEAPLQRETSVKSLALPTYEELQPPPYDVAVHISRHKSFMLAGILTWLGLKKEAEEEDPVISVIKLGILNLQKKEYDTAENILHLALKLAQERQDMQAQRYIFDVLANVAFEKGDYPKAEKLFIQVTKELLATGTSFDDNAIVEISLKLASIYSHREEREKAEKGFQFCISTQQNKLDSMDLSNVNNLSDLERDTVLLWAMSVDWYARYLLASGMFKEAKENFQKALDISERINGICHPQTLVLLNDIGSVHSLLNENDLAIENFKKAIKRSNESASSDLPAFYCNLGATYLQSGNIEKGEESCKIALRLARKMNHTVAEEDATECLKELNMHKVH